MRHGLHQAEPEIRRSTGHLEFPRFDKVLAGADYVTIFDGLTGAALATARCPDLVAPGGSSIERSQRPRDKAFFANLCRRILDLLAR